MLPLRVGPSGRYFQLCDGSPFLFVGANDAITWPGLSGLYRRRDVEGVRKYLHELAQSGINVLRLMLEYAHVDGRYFERRVGRFNPAMVRLWDDLFELCEEAGLRVLLAPWDNFWMSRRWHKHPYNRANGGPAQNPQAFFQDEETIAAIENRLKFVAARWGGVLCAWDLFNEIHPHWGGSPGEQSAVLARWGRAIREEEMRVHGWTRPQTVSIFGPEPCGGYEEMIWAHPTLDFSTTHIYHADAIDYPRNTVSPALSMAQWTHFGRERTPSTRPFTDSEHGPIALFNNEKKYLDEAFDDEYERHMMWAHLASGGAGSGMRWPARHPHVLTQGMKRALHSLSDFLPLLDWNRFEPRPISRDASVGTEGVHIFGVRDGRQAVLWLLRGASGARGVLPTRKSMPVPVEIRGLEPGCYAVRAWSTLEGREVARWEVDVDGETLRFEVDLGNDLALAVHPSVWPFE